MNLATLLLLSSALINLQIAIAESPVYIPLESPKLTVVERNPLFEAIALCESNNVATAKNPKSTAKGRFQFLNSSWNYYGKQLWGEELKNKNVLDYDDNTELAWYVFQKNGTSDWLESKPCWSVYQKT